MRMSGLGKRRPYNKRGPMRRGGGGGRNQSFESTGPDVKVRGTAQQVADKYATLARDASSSGDPVAAENYLQHAEHYQRIVNLHAERAAERAAEQQREREERGERAPRPAPGEAGDGGGDGARPARLDDGDFEPASPS